MTKARDLANASTALSAVSATELGYVDGVTSAIQTQLDAKLATATASTTYIPKSLPTAKGDLLTATASGTPAVLPVSATNGDTIVADSSTSTGLSYQANWSAGRNKFLNSNFSIWQRGTSQTTQGFGSADRWNVLCDGTFTNSQQTFTPGAAPVAGYEGQYFYRSARTTGTYMIVQQNIENVQTFAGQTVTLSYWAKCSSGTITNEPTAFQYFGSGGSGNVDIGCTPSTATVTTSWTRFSHTFTIPSISGKTIGTGSYLSFRPLRHVSATGATIDIWGLQVEASSVATAFQTATGSIQQELAACQRYYYRSGGSSVYEVFAWGVAASTAALYMQTKAPVTMRVAPTSVDYATLTLLDQVGGSFASTGIGINMAGKDITQIYVTVASGLTQYRSYYLASNNSTSGYLGFSAEL